MDQETIRKIAAELATHLPSNAWWPLLVQTLLFAGAAALGAFIGEYLKTRGKNLATKADFESLKDQLRANTELVETIKTEVSRKDWAQREWSNLRRLKLEALITGMHDCEAYLDRLRSSSLNGESLSEREPHPEMQTIAALYLPELASRVSKLTLAYHALAVIALDMGQKMIVADKDNDLDARQGAFDDFRAEWKPKYKDFKEAGEALATAARELLTGIMGVDPTSSASPTPPRQSPDAPKG